MRRLFAALAVLAFASPSAALAASRNIADLPAGAYRLDKKHASITAKVMHLGVSLYTLRFDAFDATFTYDPAHPEAAQVRAKVDTTSLDVGAAYGRRFADDFLEADKFPTMTFVSTAIRPGAEGKAGTMRGDLTLRGVTRPVTFDVTFGGVGKSLIFGTVTGFSATTTIKRSDFGSSAMRAFVGDDVRIEIEAEFDKT
ncbi:MAG: YceI family protein [Caulobacteraceae bacterium]|nr:YceI family protein [Caulobacteraceae bacterium]